MSINPNAKQECLIEFVKRCRLLHIIAFMQWRQLRRPNSKDLSKIITEKSNHLRYLRKEAIEKQDARQKAHLESIGKDSELEIPKKMLLKYKLNNDRFSLKPFHINSFEMVAMPDPFPLDH